MSSKTSLDLRAILLPLLPAAGTYAVAYEYEVGYSDTFGIPHELITVETRSLVTAGIAVLAGTVILIVLSVVSTSSSTWFAGLRMFGTRGHRFSNPLGVLLFILLGACVLAVWNDRSPLPFVIGGVFMFVFRTVSRSKQPARITPAPPTRTSTSTSDLFTIVVLGAMLPLAFARMTGGRDARARDAFPVKPGTPELVVLRSYGDRLVAATFDRKKRVVRSEFRVIPLATELTLNVEKVGPLRSE